jgi:SAM-dependent methyltransferase
MPRTKPFDVYFKRYDVWFEKNRFAYLSELEAVRHFIPAYAHGVEIGIGSGRFAQKLGIEVGVEPSRQMRLLAQKRVLQVFDAVAEHLPFEDEQFDFALMVTTICFLDNVQLSFKEAKRVIKPDGRLIVGFVDKNSFIGKTYEAHKRENVFYREATFYSTDEVIALLRDCGFQQIKTVQTLFNNLREITQVQQFRDGYGRGGFVVVCAEAP